MELFTVNGVPLIKMMKSLRSCIQIADAEVSASDREFVERQLDELLEQLFERAKGTEDRFTEMLAHFVAITVAPSLAATNMVLHLPKISSKNKEQQLRMCVSGDPNYVAALEEFENELAEAVTNAVLQTVLGPSPRISVSDKVELPEEQFLN